MNPFKRFFILSLLLVSAVFTSTAGNKEREYKTHAGTGVKYLFFKQDKKGPKPVMGDIAYVRIVYKTSTDSILFDSHEGHTDSTSIIPLTLTSTFKGSLEQGITLMATGDSASFLVSADSIYLKLFKLKALPAYIKPGSDLKFYVKLLRFETPGELKTREYAMILQRRADMQKMKKAEADSIRKYLKERNIQVKPTMVDSMYILERTGTPGRPINEGDSVEIKYTGMFLDGTVFDQSDRGDGGPGTIKIVYRHNAKLIKGWLDVLETMHQGETVRVLLPSSLAYGSYGAGKDIKPYTPLLFEIKVIRVSSPFEQ